MIGIAIINYNSYKKTIECIESIRDTTNIPFKIYLLDNASSNESQDVLAQEYKNSNDVEVINSKENLGYAKGNNICIERMKEDQCQYGVISNNDIVCTDGCIETLINDLKVKSNYLLVGPKIESPDGNYQKTIILREYTKIEYLRKNTYLANLHKRAIKKEQKIVESIDSFTNVQWVSGAFFAFSIDNMTKIGKFDPNTFLYFEESILSKKARENNLLLGYEPTALVKHYHSYSSGGWNNVKTKIAADKSEKYYFVQYTDSGKPYLYLLALIRKMEAYYTYRKKKDWDKIRIYKKEMNDKMEK